MAVGDLLNDIVNIGAGASTTFQPAGTIEVSIHGAGSNSMVNAVPDGLPDISVGLNDGANISTAFNENSSGIWFRLPIFINNAIYLNIVNTSAGAQNISYWGVQTKA